MLFLFGDNLIIFGIFSPLYYQICLYKIKNFAFAKIFYVLRFHNFAVESRGAVACFLNGLIQRAL